MNTLLATDTRTAPAVTTADPALQLLVVNAQTALIQLRDYFRQELPDGPPLSHAPGHSARLGRLSALVTEIAFANDSRPGRAPDGTPPA